MVCKGYEPSLQPVTNSNVGGGEGAVGRVGEGYNKPELEVEEEGGRALILNFCGAYQKVKKKPKQNKTKN